MLRKQRSEQISAVKKSIKKISLKEPPKVPSALSIQHHVSPPHSPTSFKTKSRNATVPSAHCIITYKAFLFQHLPLSVSEYPFLFLWKSKFYCLKNAISKLRCKTIWNLKIKPLSARTQNYTATPKQTFILLSLHFPYECNEQFIIYLDVEKKKKFSCCICGVNKLSVFS